MKLSLIPVLAFPGLDSTPKMAIVSLVKWLERNGYTQDDYDFFDVDMLQSSDQEIREYFLEYQPTVIGLSGILSSTLNEIKRVARIGRETCPDAWIIMGGHLVAAGNTVLRKTEVDICIAGDGEIPLVEFLDYVKAYGRRWDFTKLSQIKGLCFIDDADGFRFTGWALGIPAEDLEVTDYDILRRGLKEQPHLIERYFTDIFAIGRYDPRYKAIKGPHKVAELPTSKGCVARCGFCQRASKGYRPISPDKIEEHVVYLKDTFNVTEIQILDENFGSNVKQAFEVAKIMKKHDMVWKAGGVRVTTFTAEDIKFLGEHNCLELRFGLESGSDRMLGVIEKRITVEGIKAAFQNCIDADVSTHMSVWLVGHPGDDERAMMETGHTIGTLAHMLEVPVSTACGAVAYVMPVPGTPLYEYGQRVGVLPSDPDGEEKYLNHTASIKSPSKANYCNINGAPKREWYFWDVLMMLEASRIYRDLCRKHPITGESFTSRSLQDWAKSQPERQKTFKALYNSFFWAVDNRVIDALPRWFIYPVLKNLNYLCNVVIKDVIRFLIGRPDRRAFPGKASTRMKVEQYGKKVSRAVPLRRFNKENSGVAANPELQLLTRGQ